MYYNNIYKIFDNVKSRTVQTQSGFKEVLLVHMFLRSTFDTFLILCQGCHKLILIMHEEPRIMNKNAEYSKLAKNRTEIH